jgi:DNA invertase Pin-like site-specific DNA recombinase
MPPRRNIPTIDGIIYTRYSTHMQDDRYSERIQIDECKKLLKEKGCNDPLICCDRAKTGTTIRGRPGLEKAFDRLREGMVLVCYSLCRLTRSGKDA